MRLSKSFGIGTCIYLLLFLVDYVIELFQITQSGQKITLFGLKISTIMTNHSLNTNFTLTFKTLIMYLIFMLLWMLATTAIKRYRVK